MSAIYKCNLCGKKMDYHGNSFDRSIYVSKKMFKSSNNMDFYAKLDVKAINGSCLDTCAQCLEKVVKEAIKKLGE